MLLLEKKGNAFHPSPVDGCRASHGWKISSWRFKPNDQRTTATPNSTPRFPRHSNLLSEHEPTRLSLEARTRAEIVAVAVAVADSIESAERRNPMEMNGGEDAGGRPQVRRENPSPGPNPSAGAPSRGKSCKGCLYYSSVLKSKSRPPTCVGLSRTLDEGPFSLAIGLISLLPFRSR